jgi:O-antigen ligase
MISDAGTASRSYVLATQSERQSLSYLPLALVLAVVGALVVLAAYVSLPLAGAVYAIGFMALTWLRPDLAFILIFAATPFFYDVGGGPVTMAVADISVFLALPVLLMRRLSNGRPFARSPIRIPMAAYLLVCVASTLAAGDISRSIVSMLQMLVYLVVAVFAFANCVGRLQDLVPALYAMIFSNLLLAMLAVRMGSGYVLGLHKNAVGLSVGFALVTAIDLWLARLQAGNPRRRFLVFAICCLTAGLVSSLSRGSWLGTFVAVALLLSLRGRVKMALRLCIVLIPIIIIFWMILPEASKDYATDVYIDAHNTQTRLHSLDFAMGFFQSSPVLGVGVGLRKIYDATNVVASTLAETGILGLVTFSSIFLTFFIWAWRKRRAVTPELASFLYIGVALTASSLIHGCVDHYWNRGLLVVWASVGMAINATNQRTIPPSSMMMRRHS